MVFYISSVQSPYVLNLSNVDIERLNLQEVRVFVDTTTGPVGIILPAIANFPAQNLKIYVVDYLGNAAANAIAIIGTDGNNIGGQGSTTIKSNYGFLKLEIGSSNEWIDLAQQTSGGSGSGTRILIEAKDFVGNTYTNEKLINIAPFIDFNVIQNVGANVAALGTYINLGDAYLFEPLTGQLTMEPGNYLIQIY